jgi:hypothetical protein
MRPAFILTFSLCPLMAHGQVQTTRLTEDAVNLDHEFTRIKSGRELANGTLLLVDDREKQILVADFGQNTVRRIGRSGAGPGEYREPGRVHCAPGDSSLIEDRQLARWLILKGETIVREEPVMPRFDYIPMLSGGDRFGRVLDIRPLRYGQSSGLPRLPIHSHAESPLVIVDNRGSARRDTLARIRGAFRGVKRIMKPIAPGRAPIPWIVNNPLDFEDQAILFCDGWIAIVRADPYTVEWYSRDGSRVVRDALPFVRVVVDARERAVATRTEHQDIFTPDELPAWPEFVPPFPDDALFTLADGRLAVRRTATARSPRPIYDIVDRRGQLSERLELSEGEAVVAFGLRYVYIVRTDVDGVQTIRRHARAG